MLICRPQGRCYDAATDGHSDGQRPLQGAVWATCSMTAPSCGETAASGRLSFLRSWEIVPLFRVEVERAQGRHRRITAVSVAARPRG